MVAAGTAAYEIYEKVSDNIAIKRPVRGGVIADVGLWAACLITCLKNRNCSNSMMRHNEFLSGCSILDYRGGKAGLFSLVGYSSFKTHNASIVEKPCGCGSWRKGLTSPVPAALWLWTWGGGYDGNFHHCPWGVLS